MKLPSTKTLVINALCLLALLWLYGGDLWDALRARGAEVSAFLAPPPLVWPIVVLAATAAVLGVVLWGLSREQPEGFKGYRVMPILLVCALFVDLVLAESRVPLRPVDVATMSLGRFQEAAQALSTRSAVPTDPAVLRPLLDDMGQPPYLVKGVRAPAWSLQVREGCQGPVKEAPGLSVGTFIYCVSPQRDTAWVTLVALPVGERFGLPAILSEGGEPHVAVVQPALPEGDAEAAPPEAAPGGAPEATDAGEVAPAPSP